MRIFHLFVFTSLFELFILLKDIFIWKYKFEACEGFFFIFI